MSQQLQYMSPEQRIAEYRRKYQADYYKKNKLRLTKYKASRHKARQQECIEKYGKEQYLEMHREKNNIKCAKWREANLERAREHARKSAAKRRARARSIATICTTR